MTMSVIWTGMAVVSVLCGIATGRAEQVAAAAVEGAGAALELCLSIGGMLCLWTGLMEVMSRAGLAAKLARLLRPVLTKLYPSAEERGAMDAIAANVSANLLGLGNAATPPGLEAARRLHRGGSTAGDSLCMLVVCNTASIQLIPTTVAAVRSGAGSTAPFDILPAVWLASTVSVCVGICAVKLFSFAWRARQ
ncbi:MAG: spore maturation protein A [Oscillospiraceae bacterium]|nr:spore maturation protein A [Oscillospiraceae bacterium]